MTTPKDKIPSRYLRFLEKYPDLAKAYESLGLAAKEAGPLDSKTIALVKVALSGGAMLEGAFHSHLRKASKEGITKEELQHVALLAIPTIGFPSMMALMSWIDDIYIE